jgi:hypothetical protein
MEMIADRPEERRVRINVYRQAPAIDVELHVSPHSMNLFFALGAILFTSSAIIQV